VDAVDIDPEAIRTAQLNASANGVGTRVRVIQADFFAANFVQQVEPLYDVVVANPPYVTAEEFESLAPEIKNFENRRALVADENGTSFYRRMSEILPQLLKAGGVLAVEIGQNQAERVSNLFASRLQSFDVRSDLGGIPRMLIGQSPQELPSRIEAS
jgi:release factor glutamine methyltransferase